LHGPALLELADRLPPLEALRPDRAIPPALQIEALRERVHDGDADPVQPARDLVATAVSELSAGVQSGEDDFGRRAIPGLLHLVDRDPAAVVDDGAAVVRVARL